MITKVVNKSIDIVKKFCIKFSVATVNVDYLDEIFIGGTLANTLAPGDFSKH